MIEQAGMDFPVMRSACNLLVQLGKDGEMLRTVFQDPSALDTDNLPIFKVGEHFSHHYTRCATSSNMKEVAIVFNSKMLDYMSSLQRDQRGFSSNVLWLAIIILRELMVSRIVSSSSNSSCSYPVSKGWLLS